MQPTDKGFNVVVGEDVPGALVQFFAVSYTRTGSKGLETSERRRGFRIPSCYEKLQSLVHFQRRGVDCVLTHMRSQGGDSIDLYEYDGVQEEWRSTTLFSAPQTRITSISASTSLLLYADRQFQSLLSRQILMALSDGSIMRFDKWSTKAPERCFSVKDGDANTAESAFFAQILHTPSGTSELRA